MSDIRARRVEAKSRADDDDHQSAIEIWAELWAVEVKDLWDARGLAHSLRKLGRTNEAMIVCEEALAIDPRFQPVLGVLSWCLWELHIKAEDREQGKHIPDNVVDRILAVRGAAGDPYDRYWAFTKCLLDIAKHDIKSKSSTRRDRAIRVLRHLDPARLSGETERFNGRDLPGFRQRWYSLLSKALEDSEDWSAVIDVVEAALSDSAVSWVNEGDAWLDYRRAKALAGSGRFAEAIADLAPLRAKLDQWYVHDLLAQCMASEGDVDSALPVALRACSLALAVDGDIEFKVNVFKNLGVLLIRSGRQEQAGPMLVLAAAIRRDQAWPNDNELPELLRAARVAPDELTPLNAARAQAESAFAKLEDEFDPALRGEVRKVLTGGKSGFILDADGISRFFSARDCRFDSSRLREGLAVDFKRSTSFDRKKRRNSPSAIDIRLADE